MHIGSQLTDLAPFDTAFALLVGELVRDLRADGRDSSTTSTSAAGWTYPIVRAILIPISDHPDRYAAVVRKHNRRSRLHAVLRALQRPIVGNAGILVTRVIYVKRGENKSFVIDDGAMNDLIRPTLYEAYHEIVPVRAAREQRAITSPTSSGRSARPAIISGCIAIWPNPSPAISSPC